MNSSKPKEKIRSFMFCCFASLRMILKSRCLSQDCPSLRREFLKYSNCCLCVKASISICKRLKWIYLEGTKGNWCFRYVSGSETKQLGWIPRETISEVERMGQMEDLKISLITLKEKEISFRFSKIDCVINISSFEL